MTSLRQASFEVRVPASTANMGAGLDCLGLALEMYLSVRATLLSKPGSRTLARSRGVQGTSELPRDPDENLIFRAMRHTAEREGFARRASGSRCKMKFLLRADSAAVRQPQWRVSLAFAVIGRRSRRMWRCVTQPRWKGIRTTSRRLCSGLGCHVCSQRWHRCRGSQTTGQSDPVDRRHPEYETGNKKIAGRAARHCVTSRCSIQRAAIRPFCSGARRPPLRTLWDAMQDRLHQAPRQSLIPGLAEALALPRMPGLLGVALSGAGPSVVALATGRHDEIGKAIAQCFERHDLAPVIRNMEAAQEGLLSTQKYLSRK